MICKQLKINNKFQCTLTVILLQISIKIFWYLKNICKFVPKIFNNMNRLNLSKIIKQNSLKKNEIASLLFPGNKFPMAALTRVLNGEAHLDSVQISRLALFLNVTPGHLFSDEAFYGYADNYQNLMFEKDDYVAKLNRVTWLTQIFCKGSLVHETIIHNGSQPLSTYLEELDNIIETLKNKIKW